MQVHPWPQCAEQALAALHSAPGCTVLAIHTPQQDDRMVARQVTRDALRTLLGRHWQQAAHSIRFTEQPGQPITVASHPEPVWLSLSHAPGLSVATVHRHQAVGIDVLRWSDATNATGVAYSASVAEPLPDWDVLAHDYLGPTARLQLAHTPTAARAKAFARAWSQLEAGLKCHGRGLTEWTPALTQTLAQCRYTSLELPAHWPDTYVATLAVL